MSWMSWIQGLLFALLIGELATWGFLYRLRRAIHLPEKDAETVRVPAWVTGTVERLFFVIVIGLVGYTGLGRSPPR